MSDIPADRLARNPLITEPGFRRLNAILQHADAPKWNYEVGDRVVASDLEAVVDFSRHVQGGRHGTGRPQEGILAWVERMRRRVPWFAARVPEGLRVEHDWAAVATMSRADLVTRLDDIVPPDADLSRLIVYDTSGVTGHAIRVPHHPRAVAQNQVLVELILKAHGVHLPLWGADVACLNVGAQVSTVVFATVLSVWGQAGFAKVNLHPRAWQPDRARRFFAEMSPLFLTGDPLGFAEMLAWEIDAHPAAMVSTAVALSPALQARLQERYRCPVIDLYSTTETGPIAHSSPGGAGLSILPTDIYVETVDADGRPVPEGELGEVCVTGGRNPFLPLLRYRTGDFGRLVWSDADQRAPRLVELCARQPVAFHAADGSAVSPVDIGRIVREWEFVQHAFVQRRDGSCDLTIAPAPGWPIDVEAMRTKLVALFGDAIDVRVTLDARLGENSPGGKVIPWVSEAEGGRR
jgi:phenylacetate-CoA ligase